MSRNTRRHGIIGVIILMGGIAVWSSLSEDVYTKNTAREDPGFPVGYTAPRDHGLNGEQGVPIDVATSLAQRLGIPLQDFIDLNETSVTDFVLATGASENHAEEAVDCIASLQKHFPEKKIFFYDLGLSEATRTKLSGYCGVTLRTFDFAAYPPHVADLVRYAWKPIIIQGLLTEFPGVFWMDSSIRLKTGDFSIAYGRLLNTGGILQFKGVSHSNFAVTHPQTYEYFPTLIQRQKKIHQSIGGILMIYRTEDIYWNVFHWWLLCALDPACISPTTVVECDFSGFPDHRNHYVGCHRFDQAVMSLLNSNHFGFDADRYTLEDEERNQLLTIKKTVTQLYEAQTC